MELHVFNGDCACDAWRKSGETSPALVWRENYLEGRIPGADTPPDEFARIRADELHQFMPELDYEKLLSFLRKTNRTVMELSAEDSVFLWFDACMYDQVMLSRILFLLKDTLATVFLICEDIVWGDSSGLFAEKKKHARRLAPNDIALFASAWEAVAGGIAPIERLLAERNVERFPFLAKALARYREEFPDADGLGRSERQLLEIIRSGVYSEPEIFRAFGSREEYPFMGDTMCRRMLERLAEKKRISVSAGKDGYLCRLT